MDAGGRSVGAGRSRRVLHRRLQFDPRTRPSDHPRSGSWEMPRRLGNGAAATLGGEGRDCDHAQYANRGYRDVQPAGKVRRLAGFVGEHVDRLAAAEPIRFDSAAAGQFKQERREPAGMAA